MSWDLQYSNGSFVTRKLQFVVHASEERMQIDWATGSSVHEKEFRPIYCMTKAMQFFGWQTLRC